MRKVEVQVQFSLPGLCGEKQKEEWRKRAALLANSISKSCDYLITATFTEYFDAL
jgi:predicted secreted protein